MTIDDQELRALAFLAPRCRPTGARQWDPDKVMAELRKLAGRDLGAVVLATIRAAMDRHAERPEVIGSNGSHWSDTMLPRDWVPQAAPVGTRCTVCGQTKAEHGVARDHPHTPPRDPNSAEYVAHVQALRAELSPTAGPSDTRSRDEVIADCAEKDPALHANIQRARDAITQENTDA